MKPTQPLIVYTASLPDGESFSFTSSEPMEIGRDIFCRDSFGEQIYVGIIGVDGQNLQVTPHSKHYTIRFTDGETCKVSADEIIQSGILFIYRDYDGHDSVAKAESIDGNVIHASRIELPIATERSSGGII